VAAPLGIRGSELFAGLRDEDWPRLIALGQEQDLAPGEVLFELGQETSTLFVVSAGSMALTLPLVVLGACRNVRFQTLLPGRVVGWSALLAPHRATMAAHSPEAARLLAFPRSRLTALFDEVPRIGRVVMTNLATVVAGRLMATQAMWVRELQRTVEAGGLPDLSAAVPGVPGRQVEH
jgi:CRP-like cAMP-binding protein